MEQYIPKSIKVTSFYVKVFMQQFDVCVYCKKVNLFKLAYCSKYIPFFPIELTIISTVSTVEILSFFTAGGESSTDVNTGKLL